MGGHWSVDFCIEYIFVFVVADPCSGDSWAKRFIRCVYRRL